MSLMLPADPAHARSLTDVAPGLSASLRGADGWLPPATSAVLVVFDGLGAQNLSARAGHARFLAGTMAKKNVARSVFPSTTAAALTSLMTGRSPGTHGIVGYRVRIPESDILSNQLTGWEKDGLDPDVWQRSPTMFEGAAARGIPSFVVSKAEYRGSGFTRAAFRGAEFLSAGSVEERLLLAAETAAAHPGCVVYAYAPELDSLGHRLGWESDAWVGGLETVDAAVRRFDAALAPGVGALVTADHGMVDVPRSGHVLLESGSPLLEGVAAVAGEPRMLHVYADAGSADRVLAAWRTAESARSWVLSRTEAIDAGLFGEVDDEVAPRIGDVLVAARARVAYYDDRLLDKAPQKMIGQHGSLTPAERIVPLIRLGAYARG